MDQRGLVERARRGDHDAFSVLARGAVVRLDEAARLILRDPELARDAVQEGLIRAWRELPQASRSRAVRRLGLPTRRQLLHRPDASQPSAPTPSRSSSRRCTTRPHPTPARAQADRDEVDEVLRHLDERGRAIVVLHYFLGLPLTDVAATLGIPIGTVKSRLHRALSDMRLAIGAEPTPSLPRWPPEGRSYDVPSVASSSDLPEILSDLARGRYPDYIDDVLASTAELRQDRAWTFPDRGAPAMARDGASWLVLIALLLAAVIALSLGTRTRLPAPYGLARNGLVAYDADGDIFTSDPVSGVATAIVTGKGLDLGPRFSLDGTHVVFERRLVPGSGQLYVARSDGTPAHAASLPRRSSSRAPGSASRWRPIEFSPDGRSILIASTEGRKTGISIARADGSGVTPLDVGCRPPSRPIDHPMAPRSCSWRRALRGRVMACSRWIHRRASSAPSSPRRATSICLVPRGRRTALGSPTGHGTPIRTTSAHGPTSSWPMGPVTTRSPNPRTPSGMRVPTGRTTVSASSSHAAIPTATRTSGPLSFRRTAAPRHRDPTTSSAGRLLLRRLALVTRRHDGAHDAQWSRRRPPAAGPHRSRFGNLARRALADDERPGVAAAGALTTAWTDQGHR